MYEEFHSEMRYPDGKKVCILDNVEKLVCIWIYSISNTSHSEYGYTMSSVLECSSSCFFSVGGNIYDPFWDGVVNGHFPGLCVSSWVNLWCWLGGLGFTFFSFFFFYPLSHGGSTLAFLSGSGPQHKPSRSLNTGAGQELVLKRLWRSALHSPWGGVWRGGGVVY